MHRNLQYKIMLIYLLFRRELFIKSVPKMAFCFILRQICVSYMYMLRCIKGEFYQGHLKKKTNKRKIKKTIQILKNQFKDSDCH